MTLGAHLRRPFLDAAVLGAFVLWSLGVAQAADRPNAQVLVNRYVAWRGGKAFEHLQTIHATGRLTTSGLQGEVSVWATVEGRRSEHDSVDGIVTGEGVTPERAWRTNLSGQVIARDTADARNLRLEATVPFAAILRPAAAPPRLLADETLDGRAWRVVELGYPDEAFDFFLSDAGELHAVRALHHGSHRITRYDDWRDVSGVRLAFVERTGAAADGDMRRFAHIEINTTPPSDVFHPPGDLVRVSARRGDGASWLAFRLLGGRRIYLPLAINGHPVQALLDSGAETTVLDIATARSARVRPVGRMQVKGSGGSASSGLATGVTVSTGPQTLSPLTVSVMDLAPIAKALDIPLQAILGQEAFQAFVVDIDFQHRRIAFRDPATFKPPQGALRLPLIPAEGDRVTKLAVEGRAPVDVYLDLGNGSPLDLFPDYWQAQHMLQGRRSSELLEGGAGGQHPVTVAIIHSVDLGGVVLHDVPTNFPSPGDTTAGSQRVQGNLGLPILSRFRVMVDFAHDTLFLLPRRDAIARAFDRDRTGLSTVRDAGALKVTFVAPGSPAQAAGLKVGDRITAIGGQPIGDASVQPAGTDWRFGPAGRRIDLLLADRRSLLLTLRDYF